MLVWHPQQQLIVFLPCYQCCHIWNYITMRSNQDIGCSRWISCTILEKNLKNNKNDPHEAISGCVPLALTCVLEWGLWRLSQSWDGAWDLSAAVSWMISGQRHWSRSTMHWTHFSLHIRRRSVWRLPSSTVQYVLRRACSLYNAVRIMFSHLTSTLNQPRWKAERDDGGLMS